MRFTCRSLIRWRSIERPGVATPVEIRGGRTTYLPPATNRLQRSTASGTPLLPRHSSGLVAKCSPSAAAASVHCTRYDSSDSPDSVSIDLSWFSAARKNLDIRQDFVILTFNRPLRQSRRYISDRRLLFKILNTKSFVLFNSFLFFPPLSLSVYLSIYIFIYFSLMCTRDKSIRWFWKQVEKNK